MRMARIWMFLLVGGLVLTGAALAQSPDDEKDGMSEASTPSSSEEAARAESPDDEGQGRDYLAPGVRVWMGRVPSITELQAAGAEARAQAKSRTPTGSDAPTFQNDRIKIYMGKIPTLGGR